MKAEAATPTEPFLAVCIDNAVTAMGLCENGSVASTWTVSTHSPITADEVHLLLHDFLRVRELAHPVGSIMCSVVPSVADAWREGLGIVTGSKPLIVGPGLKSGIAMGYKDPGQMGGDRVACAVAAREQFGVPIIVVDFGTVTTLTVVNEEGVLLGGAIAPGIGIAMESLCDNAAQLAEVSMQVPRTAIGRSTAEAIRAGVVMGEAARVDGLVGAIWDELGYETKLVATGSFAASACKLTSHEFALCDDLALQGLRLIYERNSR
ncbi:MAG: type III pantothenate kinase [Eggerthellaceae bacterium]|nr:type III pantothenate kinase [Eggerthellaceae bacterium]